MKWLLLPLLLLSGCATAPVAKWQAPVSWEDFGRVYMNVVSMDRIDQISEELLKP